MYVLTLLRVTVDGSWTMWSSWDNCTGTCGTGTQFRDRDCTNPAPKNGGKDCVGAAKEAHTCETQYNHCVNEWQAATAQPLFVKRVGLR